MLGALLSSIQFYSGHRMKEEGGRVRGGEGEGCCLPYSSTVVIVDEVGGGGG